MTEQQSATSRSALAQLRNAARELEELHTVSEVFHPLALATHALIAKVFL